MPIPRRSFYFLRHGQTDWNAEGRFQGRSDIPLNQLGRSQARDAAAVLAVYPIDVIAASPLIRARQTAEIVAARLNRPITLDDDLKERWFGRFEGLVVNEVKARLGIKPDQRLTHQLPEDAEQWHETCARTIKVIGRWLDLRPDASVLFVAHSGLFDALHEQIFGQRIEPKHVPYHWKHGDHGWSCEAVRGVGLD